MKGFVPIILALCLLLGGCGIFDGNYTYVEPHPPEGGQQSAENVSARDYEQLCSVLAGMAENGVQSGVIAVPYYDQNRLVSDLEMAVTRTVQTSPIAAWAVETIKWELGTSGGQSAIAVDITYIHDKSEIKQISKVANLEEAREKIIKSLDDCGTGVVLLLQNYEETDFAQIVEDYADESPQTVMETPEVVTNIYPKTGEQRLVELKFIYKTSRDTLRSMQKYVRTVFDSATMLVSGYNQEQEKFEELYSFLMVLLAEGNQPLKTSITPAYSLLRYGVGNEKAFATVYAAMCREAGLECRVISGTRNGESWYWNLIRMDGVYRHLDLLRCRNEGAFQSHSDDQMGEYYWDYDMVPAGT
jgi:hypothetical protein